MESAPARRAERRRELHTAPMAVANDGLLPADILQEVLLRLPANVLCRLRLVCRSWRSLTSSDPVFARAHFSRHPLIVGLRNNPSCREVQFVDMSGNIVKRICITGQAWDYGHHVSAKPSLICPPTKDGCVLNPSTSAFTVLPANIAAEHPNEGGSPIQSLSLLGQIPSTGEYKVLRIHKYLTASYPLQTCEVMTVGDGRWIQKACPPITVAATPLHSVIVNGVACMLELYDPGHIKQDHIALFDLATEEWRSDTLRGPPKGLLPVADEKTLICLHLTKLNGCLVTICRLSTRELHYKDESIDLWFLVDMDKGLWTKMYSLQCPPALVHGLCSPLEVLNDGRILLWVSSIQCLRVYDPKTDISTDLVKLCNFLGVCLYQGSLLCPDF